MKIRLMIMALLAFILAMLALFFWPEAGREGEREISLRDRARKSATVVEDKSVSRLLAAMEHVPAGALKDEFVLIIPEASDMVTLSSAIDGRDGIRVLGSIEQLGAMLVRVESKELKEFLAEALPQRALLEYNFVSFCPDLQDIAIQDSLEAWDLDYASRIGVPKDANWGKGVNIALLDMRVGPHPSLSSARIVQYDAASVADDELGWHGTAMLSLVGGRDENLSGVAQASSLSVFPVSGPDGAGDSFALAAAVVEAVEAGAELLCVQIATDGDTQLLRAAVDYALQRNALIVAPVSDAGEEIFPAAIDGVLSVCAADSKGKTVGRSVRRYGLLAPGVGISIAAPKGELALVDGSGSAAMIVTGVIAGLIYEAPGLSPSAASDLLKSYSASSGFEKGVLGGGLLDVERVRSRNISGIRDLAVTGIETTPSADGSMRVRVAVQNKGTSTTAYTLEVSCGGQAYRFSSSGLQANAWEYHSFDAAAADSVEAVITALASDARHDNDRMAVQVGR
ncbi:MAG: hypothetical protein JW942_05945 [Opitutales bacterium]|nr:hypothetical protein [Opitutales bacterium]